eukprot:CAMPEP_0173107764 /NCGR_PEP_ID=MMETSP1102-20130122/42104_1 /TAXON_ID=49646 /ORGANISM="Geminigera sp., Strain Caron Lab Isolate" /LENGTH=40 /DNA_ID= /DNA_START= /DNA_END= /DNA_ORIENTATION=
MGSSRRLGDRDSGLLEVHSGLHASVYTSVDGGAGFEQRQG